MRIQVLLASAATALVLSCGASSAAPTVAGGDAAKGQNADRGIVLAQKDGGGGGGARFSGGGGGRAVMGGGGGARFYGGGAASPRFYGRGGGARFSEAGARARVAGAPPRRWQGAANWRRNWRPGYGGGYYPYYGYGAGWGLGYGLGLGYGWGYGYPYYGDTYYYDAPVVYSGGGGDVAYCAQRFKSYDPRSGTYLGYDGRRHPCP